MQWSTKEDTDRARLMVALARQAVAQRPQDGAAWANLGRQLLGAGAIGEAVAALREAPRSAQSQSVLAKALEVEGKLEDALSAAELALTIEPGHREAQRRRLHLLAALRRLTPAEAGDLTPFVARSHRLMEFQTHRVPPEQALALCDQVLAEHPAHGDARFLKALALARLGRNEEARAIIDLQRDIAVLELDTPAAYESGDALRAALAAAVKTDPTLVHNPKGRSAKDLSATRDLSHSGAKPISDLIAAIKAAVDAYEMQLDPAGSFHRAKPARAGISIWASLNSGGGRQTSHRHPDGWLSGVYYVTSPRPAGENAYRGPLVLGALEKGEGIPDPPWGRREIEPVPGRLVLFPSYVPHATEATQSPEERISIAFDVVRA